MDMEQRGAGFTESTAAVDADIGVAANLDMPLYETPRAADSDRQQVSTRLHPIELGRVDIADGKYSATLVQADSEVSVILRNSEGRKVMQLGVNQYGATTDVIRDGDNVITIKHGTCVIEVGVRPAGVAAYLRARVDAVAGALGIELPSRVDAAFEYHSSAPFSRYANENAHIEVRVPGARTEFHCLPRG